jgi:hypothetical protein
MRSNSRWMQFDETDDASALPIRARTWMISPQSRWLFVTTYFFEGLDQVSGGA